MLISKSPDISSLLPPSHLLPLLRLQIPLPPCRRRILLGIRLAHVVRSPHPLNTHLKRPRHPIRQPNPNALNLLPHNLRLRLHHKPVVRPDKVVPPDQHRLPLARLLGEQPVLVQICRHHALRLHVDKICPSVGLDAQREVCVGVDIPQATAEDGGATVVRAERGEARALDIFAALGELCRYVSVEPGVALRVGGCSGGRWGWYPVEVCGRGAADVDVGHDFAVVDGVGGVEVEQLVGPRGALDAL